MADLSSIIDYGQGSNPGAVPDAARVLAAKRKDSLSTLSDADGTYTTPLVNNQGAMWVQIGSPINVNGIGNSASLGDATANPNVGSVGAYAQAYNGSTWDRVRSGQTSNGTTVTGFLNTLGMARYNATPTARTEGQFGNLQSDANGNIQVNFNTLISGEDQTRNVLGVIAKQPTDTTYLPTTTQNLSFTTTNIKAQQGVFLGFRVINTTASVRYLQIHNTATTPAGGATAHESFLIPANSQVIISKDDLSGGRNCSNGIAIANSTAASTYTAGSAGDLLVEGIDYV